MDDAKGLHNSIVACATPRGPGALALVRISGDDAWDCVAPWVRLAGKKHLLAQSSHTVHYGTCRNQSGAVIDHVMVTLMRGPKTFTGEDTVEITCHNNPLIIAAIIDTCIAYGAHPAQPGEFTRRALEHGKLTVLQAEAIHELISAQTEQALKGALSQLSGSLSSWIHGLENRLLSLLALSDASFEFEEFEHDVTPTALDGIQLLEHDIAHIKKAYDLRNQIRSGFRVALIGPVNAGKSSLFNRLIGYNRAIVTPQAGTTRDAIEASLSLGGTSCTLIDTAGIRLTNDHIEHEGIQRSLTEASSADIVVLAIDSKQDPSQEFLDACSEIIRTGGPGRCIAVFTKADDGQQECTLLPGFMGEVPCVATSAQTGHGCERLCELLQEKVLHLMSSAQAPFLINQRHMLSVVELEKQLGLIKNLLNKPNIHYELVSHHLREALECLSNLSGKTLSEAARDKIFSNFCIGK